MFHIRAEPCRSESTPSSTGAAPGPSFPGNPGEKAGRFATRPSGTSPSCRPISSTASTPSPGAAGAHPAGLTRGASSKRRRIRAEACRRGPGSGRGAATVRKEDPDREAGGRREARVPANPLAPGRERLLEVVRRPLRGSAPSSEEPDRGGSELRPEPSERAGGVAVRPRRPD